MNQPTRREFLLTTLTLPIVGAVLTAQTQTKQPLKVAFIGSGRQGGALGLQFAKAGHEVMFSSRHPETLKDLVAKAGAKARAGLPDEAATWGEVIVIAVPYGSTAQVGKDYGPLMKGKVVIDLGNPNVNRDGPMATEAIRKGTVKIQSTMRFMVFGARFRRDVGVLGHRSRWFAGTRPRPVSPGNHRTSRTQYPTG